MSEGWSPQPIAWLHHEWEGGGTLFAYPSEPAEVTRLGERLHDGLYGLKQHKSPRTPYLGQWRDTARHTAQDRKLGWPTQLFVTCVFGEEPREPSLDLMEEARWQDQHDSAHLRLKWEWQDTAYRLLEFGLELQHKGISRLFRSFHRGPEIDQLDLAVEPVSKPAEDGFLPIRLGGQVRARYNYGDALAGPAMRFSVMGSIAPIPDWLIY